jgi:hypothetical protein
VPLAKIHVVEGRYDDGRIAKVSSEAPGENFSFGRGEAQRANAVSREQASRNS